MDTRTELLNNALNLFHREGYEKAGIQKIVEASGVGKPTLYYYFKSKKGLLKCLLEESFFPFWFDLEKAVEYERDLTKNLESIFKVYFEFANQNSKFYQWYMGLIYAPKESDPGEIIPEYLKRQINYFETLFEKAANEHGNMRGRAKRYSFALLGQINSAITASVHGHEPLTDENAYLYCKQFMHGIFS